MMIIIAIPVEMTVGYITDEYAAKRPDLSVWGLHTDHWIGSNGDSRVGAKGPSSTLVELFESLGIGAGIILPTLAQRRFL
jgi:hypothetical protein